MENSEIKLFELEVKLYLIDIIVKSPYRNSFYEPAVFIDNIEIAIWSDDKSKIMRNDDNSFQFIAKHRNVIGRLCLNSNFTVRDPLYDSSGFSKEIMVYIFEALMNEFDYFNELKDGKFWLDDSIYDKIKNYIMNSNHISESLALL